jgi:putative transcription antitermination factor YqgF
MNALAIDYGTKRVGFAYSINGIISTLPMAANDENLIPKIRQIIDEQQISKVYVGLSEGRFAKVTKSFVLKLSTMIKLPVETVEEAVSTIEADSIYLSNKKSKRSYKKLIDSIAAAVILQRVIS